jgi:C1A family cysteine protease
LALLAVAVTLAAAAPLSLRPTTGLTSDEAAFLFRRWQQQYNVSYASANEAELRANIFATNLAKIQEHNELFEAGEESFRMAANKFADRTVEEFRDLFTGLRRRSTSERAPEYQPSLKDVPDSVDWRKKGVVTAVKDQGMCGSCWAFSMVGAAESAGAIATGKLVSLSEQQVVDCSKNHNLGCNGGDPRDGYDDIIKEGGFESEADYKYKGTDGHCKFDKSKIAVPLKSYENTKQGDESSLIDACANKGPVSICVDVEDAWMFYDSGILQDKDCKSGFNDLNHCVVLVGYDKDAFLIKNSWGASWGEDGYIRVARGSNMCGVATEGTIPDV